MVIVICFSLIIITNAKSSISTVKIREDEDKPIILIDPGHGGLDGGAVSKSGTVEKHINLKISLKLKEELEKKGFKIVMTRNEDVGLYSDKGKVRNKKIEDLNNRCKMKKTSNCNMFISIHLNKFSQSKYYGAQVWYSKNPDSRKLAEVIQSNIIVDLDNGNYRKSKPAENMYKILRNNDEMPSVIVECGFLSNEKEETMLKEEEYQKKIAKSIGRSIEEYFKNSLN
ncbi:N-acetylmuramoyl-L-alanine amidase CwlD [Haloimpatiens sp. FM7315]|uniref:N-acetylmuramoyl-L-alanine amidase CwlD n=1 Tax=Haloimpatiens sp. FM7315 TaxID=3298609 RepID=UPI00370B2D3B